MIESTKDSSRSVISDLDEPSIFETVSSPKAFKSKETMDKTTLGEGPLYVTAKTTAGRSAPTVADPSKPGFGGLSSHDIKRVNRTVTRKIQQTEKDKIIDERNQLVRKQFKVGLSAREKNRLKYVRWQLDRIDDAESGESLDYLQIIAEGNERFSKELNGLLGQIQDIQNKGTQIKKRRKFK